MRRRRTKIGAASQRGRASRRRSSAGWIFFSLTTGSQTSPARHATPEITAFAEPQAPACYMYTFAPQGARRPCHDVTVCRARLLRHAHDHLYPTSSLALLIRSRDSQFTSSRLLHFDPALHRSDPYPRDRPQDGILEPKTWLACDGVPLLPPPPLRMRSAPPLPGKPGGGFLLVPPARTNVTCTSALAPARRGEAAFSRGV